jgi:hypothetical protein
MKKKTFMTMATAVILMVGIGCSNGLAAEININVGINAPPPPPLAIPAPPPMFVIPGTYIYFAPEVDVNIFFYQGHWYRPYRGHWYRSRVYDGKWVYVAPRRVPRVLLDLPPDFRRVPPGYRHIPYRDVRKNWKAWEREKYWERHGGRDWHRDKWEHDEGRGRGRGRHGD